VKGSPTEPLTNTPRDQRLNSILKDSGQMRDSLLLSERFRENSSLRRQYLDVFEQPDWLSRISMNTHFELYNHIDTKVAGSIDIESILQLGGNIEASGRWALQFSPQNLSVVRDTPSLTPSLELLTLTYGKMRTVEMSLGLLPEKALLIPSPTIGLFSGVAAAIHPLRNKTEPKKTHWFFQVEHGWCSPTSPAGTSLHSKNTQRTRPAFGLRYKSESMLFSGSAALEWYTDPNRVVGLMSDFRANRFNLPFPNEQKTWRIFVLESALELQPLQNTRFKILANRTNNALATKLKTSWSSSLSITRDYSISKNTGFLEVKTAAFNTEAFATPPFRLPIELSPASRGVLVEFMASLKPIAFKNHELSVRLNYLQERQNTPTVQGFGCQDTNINRNKSCELYFGQLSLVRTLGPNL
jgi:hypothetical protein